MALKYADYENKAQLEQELSEAQAKPQRNIPENVVKRFDGKSVEDVLESYSQLEHAYNSRNDEIGTLRKTVNDLVSLSARSNSSETQVRKEPEKPVTVDDLYNDTEGTIGSVVEKKSEKTNERIKQLETELQNQKLREQVVGLAARFPKWQEDIQTPAFKEWVNTSTYRQRLASAANAYDFDAANDLLSAWKEHSKSDEQLVQEQRRDSQFRAATLESSGGTFMEASKGFSRNDLQEKRLAAKRGDLVAERWLRANADAIAIAYEEGNLTP